MGLKHLAMAALAGTASAKLPKISMKGQKFFYENGTQFFMKGIAYQEEIPNKGGDTDSNEYKDPLADVDLCKRDVPLLEELGINTIRTYAINPKADHSGCMKLLEEAGIYVISDLSQPALSIKRDAPAWDTDLLQRYTDVVDELAQYQNVIGFFAGNEVSDASNNTEASAYVKAALRDTKKHIKDQDYRWMGVGYASNDHPDIREEIATYFNCGKDEEATDYWGYNIYSWCGKSDMQKSGYSDQAKFFKDYGVPVFFAEYGCNVPDGAAGRIFQETGALYNDEMTEVFSGGLVYMYHQEENDYGVVKIKNGKAEKQDDFKFLKQEHAKADPKGVEMDEYKADGTNRETCPEIGKVWRANSVLPPTPDKSLCDCMVAASECGPSDSLKPKNYGDIFSYICAEEPELCTHINGNATTGVYGAYSMCNAEAKLTYVLGAYAAKVGGSDSCDHDGKAQSKKDTSGDKCSSALESASKVNDEVATATAVVDASEDKAEDDESFGVLSSPMTSLFSVGLYMTVALGAGAAMVVL
jgi:hypothetical protein